MSVTARLAAIDNRMRSELIRGRKPVLFVAGAVLCLAVAVLVVLLTISTVSNGETSVLIGSLDSDRLAGLALIGALASLATGLCAVPVDRLWLVLMIPARLIAIAATCLAAFLWWLTSSATAAPLMSGGCETGYVVQEESFMVGAWGTVYQTNGLLVTAVERVSADNGYHPFADGAYRVVDDGNSLSVWYNFDGDHGDSYTDAPVRTDRDPDLTLPKLPAGEAMACASHPE